MSSSLKQFDLTSRATPFFENEADFFIFSFRSWQISVWIWRKHLNRRTWGNRRTRGSGRGSRRSPKKGSSSSTTTLRRGAAIAQWIHLRLPSWSPGFKSKAHNLSFKCLLYYLSCEKKENKQKEAGFWPIFKKTLTLIPSYWCNLRHIKACL